MPLYIKEMRKMNIFKRFFGFQPIYGPKRPLPKAPEGGTGESLGSMNGGKRVNIVVNTHSEVDELKYLGMLRQGYSANEKELVRKLTIREVVAHKRYINE